MKLYTFRTVRLSIIRFSFTVHSAMVYKCMSYRFVDELSGRPRMEKKFYPGSALKPSTSMYDIYHC